MKLVILGAGSNARETLDVVDARRQAGDPLELLGFLVEPRFAKPGTSAHGSHVLGDIDWLEGRRLEDTVGFCAVGAPAVRRRLAARAAAFGLRFISLVHPAVSVGGRDRVGPGSLVQKGSSLTSDVQLGAFVHVYAGCLLAHAARVGDYATLCPGVAIGGDASVGEGATVGIGANVIQRCTVGPWSIVGAGATVVADVPPDSTVVGVPARVIDRRPRGWHLDPDAKSPF